MVKKYPTPRALETTLKQRKGYHEKWDMNKQKMVDKFFTHYSQFNKFKMPRGDFNWLWYYAMQQMGDDESVKQSQELCEKLEKHNEASANIA